MDAFVKPARMSPPASAGADDPARIERPALLRAGAEDACSEDEFLLLRECASLLAGQQDLRSTLREILHLLSELLGLNRGRIVLHDTLAGDWAIRYSYGLTRSEAARGRYRPGEGITGQVLRSGRPVIVQDIDHEPAWLGRAVERARLPQETVAFIAVPLKRGHRTMGVLACHRLRARTRPLSRDLTVLSMIATFISLAIERWALVEQELSQLQSENAGLRATLGSQIARHGIVGESLELHQAIARIEQVAQTDTSVLLLGETGTGKELFARALHMGGPRRERPFIKVNCAALPEALFESDMFGHERGAFSGAIQPRAGRFEQANGGTLFIDEIGELPLAMQARLLRVLQEGVIQRVGAREEQRVDVRIITATNRDLHALVRQGGFRADLFYRLGVVPVTLPPLRERKGDIRLLAGHLLGRCNVRHQRNVFLDATALQALEAYHWPGNIRQLENVIERLVLLSGVDEVDGAAVRSLLALEQPAEAVSHVPGNDLPATTLRAPPPAERSWHPAVREYRNVSPAERDVLITALEYCQGNKSRAAQSLGMTLRQFNYRLQKLGPPAPAG